MSRSDEIGTQFYSEKSEQDKTSLPCVAHNAAGQQTSKAQVPGNDLCVFGSFRLFLPVPFCICFKRVTWIMHILRLQLEGTLLLENVSQEEKGQLDQNADGSLDPNDGSFCGWVS